ncbi:MAG: hypothetical protein GY909_10675 [Oligoflexia bacterium]|nr:hypothetical protein [Oligoflexia bacterium]
MKVALFAMTFLLIGCSSVSKDMNSHESAWRGPSSSKDTNCYSLMRQLYEGRRQGSWSSSTIKNRLAQINERIASNDITSLREEFPLMIREVNNLKDEANALNDSQAIELAIEVYASVTEAQSKSGVNISSYLSEKFPRLFEATQELFEKVSSSKAKKKGSVSVQLDQAFGGDVSSIGSKRLRQFDDDSVVKDELEKLAYYSHLKDPARVISRKGSDFDYDLFNAWMTGPGNIGPFDLSSNKSLKEVYEELKDTFTDAVKTLSKKDKEELFDLSKQVHLQKYNDLTRIEIGSIENAKDFRDYTYQLMFHFRKIEDRFKDFDFEEKWLRERKFFSEDNFEGIKSAAGDSNKTIGELLEKEYVNFAPYSEIPLKVDKKLTDRMKDGMMAVVGRVKDEVDSCKTPTCIAKRIKDKITPIFSRDFYSNKFSCMVKNPLVIRNMVIELSIAWSAIIIYYKENQELFERFPYELIANGAVFAPIMNEANCRASFKGNLSFGRLATKAEVFPANSTRLARYFGNLKSLGYRGTLSTIGLITFTWGFDQLALAMGQAIARPLDMSEMMKVLPFLLLYNGVWNNVKGLAFINPIRHKLIPRFAKAFQKRFKLPGTSLLMQAGLDFGFFYYISKYNSWEYLSYYKEKALPALMGMFGLTQVEEEEERENTDFVTGREVTVTDEVVNEDEDSITYERSLSNGVETKLVMEKQADGSIRIVEVAVDAPDEVIEEAVDAIVMEPQE